MTFQDFLIGALVLLVGLAFCFAGYRFFRILIAIWGFFAGFNLGAGAMAALFQNHNFLGTSTGLIVGIVLGLVFALLAYLFYYFAVVLLGASVGYSIGTGLIGAISPNLNVTATIVGIVVAVVFAFLILALNLPKLLIMVMTALGGAVAILGGLMILTGQVHTTGSTALQYGVAVALVTASWFWSLVAIALAVVGFLAQWRSTQEYTLVWTEPTQSS
jgi:Domain of unknown function (DUF4203)